MNKKNNMVLISGLALFSMFFGAGNLIFPPTLGRMVGSNFVPAILGFVITAVGIVMLGVIATTKAGGSIDKIADKLGGRFSLLFGTLILLAIGPGLAIPRTAATTFEVIQGSLLPNLSPVVSSIIFFAIVLFFVLNPTSMIDRLGKFLTPALLITLALIIFKGFTTPLGQPSQIEMENIFGMSFEEGYQTMDALAALVFTSVIIKGFQIKGIKDNKTIVNLTIKAGIFASVFLCIVYGGLLYIGATTSSIDLGEIGRVPLLIYIAENLLGALGKVVLSIAMALACLTTAIGLTSTVGTFFNKASKNKLSYKAVVIISTIFSAYFAVMGVDFIVKFSVPILLALYPVSIVLIFLNLFPNIFKSKSVYVGAVSGAFIPTLIKFTNYLEGLLPASFDSFLWIIPVMLVGVIFAVLDKNSKI